MSKSISTTNSQIASLFSVISRVLRSSSIPLTATERKDMLLYQGKLIIIGAGKLVTTGAETVPVDPSVTLPAITITPAGSFQTDVAANTVLATVSALPAGATRVLTVAGGVAVLSSDKTQVLRSGTGTLSVGALALTVTDTHPTASNSPRTASASITITAVAVPVTLPDITVSPSSASVQTDVAAGTTLATISAVPSGATRSLSPNDGRAVFNSAKTALVRGATSASAGSTTYTITDTLAGATNSPRSTTFALTFTAPVVVDPPPAAGATITTARMEGTGAPSGTIHTFAQAFQQGHVTPSDTVVLKLADGTTIPTQMDMKGYPWSDSSGSHAVIHISVPFLSAGALNNATICKATPGSVTPINMAAALSGRTARVEISNGANVFTYDLVANLGANRWWSGALAAQTRYLVAVPRAAVGGGTDVDLQVDLTAYADGSLAVDVMPWNRRAWTASQGDAVYTIKIIGDNGFQVSRNVTRQILYAGVPLFGRWKADGSPVAQPVWMTPPTSYIAKTGLVANHDVPLGVASSLLEGWANDMAQPEWSNYLNQPYYVRGIKKDQGPAGARPDIGETTLVNSVWLITGDKRAQQYATGQADAYFSAPLHAYDQAHNSWPTPVYRPWNRTRTEDATYTRSSDYYSDSGDTINPSGWQIDDGHWGDHYIVPYLLTGKRLYLDGLMANAAYAVMWRGAGTGERGDITHDFSVSDADTTAGQAARLASIRTSVEGIKLENGVQIRSMAWSERFVQAAGILAPASVQPHGDYFRIVMDTNLKALWSEKPTLATIQGDQAGAPARWIYESNEGIGAPWQMMMRAAMLTRAARMGYANGVDMAEWAGNFIARLVQNHTGWNGADATLPKLRFGPHDMQTDPLTDGTYYKTYAQLAANGSFGAFGNNYANVAVDIGTDFALRAKATIAQVWDLLNDNGRDLTQASAAWAQLQAIPQDKTYTRPSDFQREAYFSIVRFGETRAA